VARGPVACDVVGTRDSPEAKRLINALPKPTTNLYKAITFGVKDLLSTIQPPKYDHQAREELLGRLQRIMQEGFPRMCTNTILIEWLAD
jgi:hypothetical protein